MAREWSVTTESVKRSSERIGELVSKYQTEYEKLYTEAHPHGYRREDAQRPHGLRRSLRYGQSDRA